MKKLAELTHLLDFMEENIDLDHIRKIEQLQYDAINYKQVDRLPLTIRTTPDGFEQIPLEEAYEKPEKMLYNEILWSTMHSSYNSVRTKDDGPLMVRSNHGIGIIASMFGCKSSIFNNQMPWVDHISMDEAKKVFSKGVPDVKTALGKRVIETYQYYHERLKAFPKCYEAIRITQPDMQGPFDIFHLIVGNEAFLLPYDEPELTKDMVNIIAHTYVQFRKEIDPLLTDKIHDAVFVHGFCCGGRVLVKADTPTANLSPDMYKLYEAEPDAIILDAFKGQGGGSLHYCGESKPWHKEMICDENLRCVNYGNPEMHDLEDNYGYLKEKDVAIIGWGFNQNFDEMRNTILSGDDGKPVKTGMTLMCKSDDVEHGKEVLTRHKELSEQDRL